MLLILRVRRISNSVFLSSTLTLSKIYAPSLLPTRLTSFLMQVPALAPPLSDMISVFLNTTSCILNLPLLSSLTAQCQTTHRLRHPLLKSEKRKTRQTESEKRKNKPHSHISGHKLSMKPKSAYPYLATSSHAT